MDKHYAEHLEYQKRIAKKLGPNPPHDTWECPNCGSALEGTTGKTIQMKCFTCWVNLYRRKKK